MAMRDPNLDFARPPLALSSETTYTHDIRGDPNAEPPLSHPVAPEGLSEQFREPSRFDGATTSRTMHAPQAPVPEPVPPQAGLGLERVPAAIDFKTTNRSQHAAPVPDPAPFEPVVYPSGGPAPALSSNTATTNREFMGSPQRAEPVPLRDGLPTPPRPGRPPLRMGEDGTTAHSNWVQKPWVPQFQPVVAPVTDVEAAQLMAKLPAANRAQTTNAAMQNDATGSTAPDEVTPGLPHPYGEPVTLVPPASAYLPPSDPHRGAEDAMATSPPPPAKHVYVKESFPVPPQPFPVTPQPLLPVVPCARAARME